MGKQHQALMDVEAVPNIHSVSAPHEMLSMGVGQAGFVKLAGKKSAKKRGPQTPFTGFLESRA